MNQKAEEVITGTADVIAPTEKISRPRVVLPDIELRRKGRRYELLLKMTHGLDPIRTAVVHPVDTPSLLGAVEAARINLITPVLIGPEAKIRAAAALASSIWRLTRSFDGAQRGRGRPGRRHGPRRQGRSADERAPSTPTNSCTPLSTANAGCEPAGA